MKLNSTIRFAAVLACAGVLHVSAAGAATETVVYSFKGGSDGAVPKAGLINVTGTLYGTTEVGGGTGCGGVGCGAVFSIFPDGTNETLWHVFKGGRDGANPIAGLIKTKATLSSKIRLYGTTANGGGTACYNGSGCGTVYSITPSGVEKVIYSFKGGNEGANPAAGLIRFNGTLYGTTSQGGVGVCNSGCGTVFSISSSGAEKVLYPFCSQVYCSDGTGPRARLINVNGTLYGTTGNGGSTACYNGNGCGTVFSITPSGTEKVVYAFKGGNDGAFPSAGLIDVNGTLYGTTSQGGTGICSNGCGTVFSITPGGPEKVLYSFKGGNDGANPAAGLIKVNGTLYGTTSQGGAGICGLHCGTVFSITPGGTEKVLYAFCSSAYCSDGALPYSGLINVKGILYGTTSQGGTGTCGFGCGTVFSITP
jgi:uncharacterized repeat protein (TIGR03803 family)